MFVGCSCGVRELRLSPVPMQTDEPFSVPHANQGKKGTGRSELMQFMPK